MVSGVPACRSQMRVVLGGHDLVDAGSRLQCPQLGSQCGDQIVDLNQGEATEHVLMKSQPLGRSVFPLSHDFTLLPSKSPERTNDFLQVCILVGVFVDDEEAVIAYDVARHTLPQHLATGRVK